ncbi:MAG: metallophosphoesterase [Christensenellales bacterium]|jgi:predicted MPP superfamily phosphohydrolase
MSCIAFSGHQSAVRETEYAFENLPEGLNEKNIVFVADVHHSRSFPERALDALCETIRALAPDILVIGGDNAESEREQEAFFARMANIPAEICKVCVPGNNDWECFHGSYKRLKRLCAASDVRLLANEWMEIPVAGGRLINCGCDDAKYGQPKPSSLPLHRKQGDFVLLASHSPHALPRILSEDRATPDLVLCGHTHGGQIRIGRISPYLLLRKKIRNNPYFIASGERDFGGMRLLVSCGVGMSRLPLRVGAMPEIHKIVLRTRE